MFGTLAWYANASDYAPQKADAFLMTFRHSQPAFVICFRHNLLSSFVIHNLLRSNTDQVNI